MSVQTKSLARIMLPRPARNWLRSPRRSAAWAWNEARHLFGANRRVEIRPGWHLTCHPTSYDYAYFAQVSDPEQVEEFDGFVNVCVPGMVLFDVGAHFGLFSLAALHFGGSQAKALAVDPSPAAARMMKIQSRLNGAQGRIFIVQAAVEDREGWRQMVSTGVNGAGYFVAPEDHSGRELTATRTTTLDALADEYRMRPTHIKVDVEGAEAAVLRGAKNVLSAHVAPFLFLELHNEIVQRQMGDPAESLRLLEVGGYKIFSTDMQPISEGYILSKPLLRVVAVRQR